MHNALAYLKKIYVTVARQFPGDLPGIADWLKPKSVFLQLVNGIVQVDKLGQINAMPPFQSVLDFYNRTDSHYLDKAPMERSAANVPLPPQVHEFDFHEALSMLAEYPLLMGKLGLRAEFHPAFTSGRKSNSGCSQACVFAGYKPLY